MASIPETITLDVRLSDLNDLTSSRLLSMAEAALDICKPRWREWSAEMRQESKEELMFALFEAAVKNPVGVRCGVAISEGGHDEQSAPPHSEGVR